LKKIAINYKRFKVRGMAPQKTPQKNPISLRLSDEMESRLERCVERTGMKKQTLAQAAITAAVEAIEKNDFKLVLPVKFEVTHIAIPQAAAGDRQTYPAHQPSPAMNDTPPPKEKPKKLGPMTKPGSIEN
jgi:predicted DNA-binding protein